VYRPFASSTICASNRLPTSCAAPTIRSRPSLGALATECLHLARPPPRPQRRSPIPRSGRRVNESCLIPPVGPRCPMTGQALAGQESAGLCHLRGSVDYHAYQRRYPGERPGRRLARYKSRIYIRTFHNAPFPGRARRPAASTRPPLGHRRD
jgi:hypothetical protein